MTPMISRVLLVTIGLYAFGVASTLGSPFAADWLTGGDPATGTIQGVNFTIANFTNVNPPASITTTDFSENDTDFDLRPLTANQEALGYGFQSDWTVTFDSPLPKLFIYVDSWRLGDYQFSQNFTIVDGFNAGSIINSGTTLSLPSGFHDGILEFLGPITTLSIAIDGDSASQTEITFATIPEPAGAASTLIAPPPPPRAALRNRSTSPRPSR